MAAVGTTWPPMVGRRMGGETMRWDLHRLEYVSLASSIGVIYSDLELGD